MAHPFQRFLSQPQTSFTRQILSWESGAKKCDNLASIYDIYQATSKAVMFLTLQFYEKIGSNTLNVDCFNILDIRHFLQ